MNDPPSLALQTQCFPGVRPKVTFPRVRPKVMFPRVRPKVMFPRVRPLLGNSASPRGLVCAEPKTTLRISLLSKNQNV